MRCSSRNPFPPRVAIDPIPALLLCAVVLSCAAPAASTGDTAASAVTSAAPNAASDAPGSATVTVAADGRLVYTPDARGDTIPDFSYAGYHGGGVRPPDVDVVLAVDPIPGDATSMLQAALDDLSSRPVGPDGFRGALLITAGTYRISGTLNVRASGIVIRGEGDGEDGTVLLATGRGQRTLLSVAPSPVGSRREVAGTRQTITDAYVPVGARSFHVASAGNLSVGDAVVVHRPSTANWIHDLGMDRIPPRPDGSTVQWTAGSKDLSFDRTITAIDGDLITIDAPLPSSLDANYGGGFIYRYTYPERLEEVGIEYLRGDSEFTSRTDENHGWTFIALRGVQNAWVRNITAIHFGYSAVLANQLAKWVTVQDSTSLDPISQVTGGRRYPFNIDKGELVLFNRCYSESGRHDFVTGSTVPGPNVFLDGYANNSLAEVGPHHRWAVGSLFDNITVTGRSSLSAYNRGNSGTGHGWAGANQVFWNSTAPSMRCEEPPTAHNWNFGALTPSPRGNCEWVSRGTPVAPASLYRAQLEERLGPDAVLALD